MTPDKTQNKTMELVLLGFSAWGVVSSTRQIVLSWQEDDKLERAANIAGLASSVLGLVVAIRKYRRERS